MSKFDNFINKADEFINYNSKDKFDKFMWQYGKWFVTISMPFIKEMWWYERMANPTLWLWLLIVVSYFFIAFFCFVDVYKLWKRIRTRGKKN